MRINEINIYNFGSYEGLTVFNTKSTEPERNIILIGGKNGAGKTTFFTALRLCLYGHNAYGYQSSNAYYFRRINKLINNTARLSKPTNAYISMEIALTNGQTLDIYEVKREWTLLNNQNIEELFTVIKNGNILPTEEVRDFEKYLGHMIPPELFNLYFFDGEKIADFFLEDGNNTRFKKAFLTLCGYDTFEIMSSNFKRLNSSTKLSNSVVEEYLLAKEDLEKLEQTIAETEAVAQSASEDLSQIESELLELDNQYKASGGVTHEEWNQMLSEVRQEEVFRESKNTWLKRVANDFLPFLILRDEVIALKEQIKEEEKEEIAKNFITFLTDDEFGELFTTAIEKEVPIIGHKLMNRIKSDLIQSVRDRTKMTDSILDLSSDQKSEVLYQIKSILEFDENNIPKVKKEIKKSIGASRKIREAIEKRNIEMIDFYISKRNELQELKEDVSIRHAGIVNQLAEYEISRTIAEDKLMKARRSYETELKKGSIGDVSQRAILFLDKLQDKLYEIQINKIEEIFRREVNSLIWKSQFIDDISIDKSFTIRIYKYQEFDIDSILELSRQSTAQDFARIIGDKAVRELETITRESGHDSLEEAVRFGKSRSLTLPIEIDQNTLSNGEKQIFIMSLYRSLMQLSQQEAPYVIDTPFARIDKEHRINIVDYFFRKLRGQVFILSTNEEINNDHIEAMKDKLLRTFLLENTDNKRTKVKNDQYFEV